MCFWKSGRRILSRNLSFFQTDQISLVLLNFLSQSWSTPCFLKYCAKVLCHLSFPLTSKNPDVRVEEKKNFLHWLFYQSFSVQSCCIATFQRTICNFVMPLHTDLSVKMAPNPNDGSGHERQLGKDQF